MVFRDESGTFGWGGGVELNEMGFSFEGSLEIVGEEILLVEVVGLLLLLVLLIVLHLGLVDGLELVVE